MTIKSFERAQKLVPEIESLKYEVTLLLENENLHLVRFWVSGHEVNMDDFKDSIYQQVLTSRQTKLADLEAEFESL